MVLVVRSSVICSTCRKGVRYTARSSIEGEFYEQINSSGLRQRRNFGLGGSAWRRIRLRQRACNAPCRKRQGCQVGPTDEELIASAMKAAPKKVGENATIVAPDRRVGCARCAKEQWLHVHA